MRKTVIALALLAATGAWAQASNYETNLERDRNQVKPAPRVEHRVAPRVEHRAPVVVHRDHRAPVVQHRDYRYNNHDRYRRPHRDAVWHDNDGWILPAAIFGGLLTYSLMNQPQTVIVEQAPAPVYVEPTVVAPIGYKYVYAYDESCPCWKPVLVPRD